VVALSSHRVSIVRDAINVVLRRLSALPLSPAVVELRDRAEHHLREVDGWTVSTPAVEHRDTLMIRMLNLHVEVVRLERSTRRV
jgi:hypothetical protein